MLKGRLAAGVFILVLLNIVLFVHGKDGYSAGLCCNHFDSEALDTFDESSYSVRELLACVNQSKSFSMPITKTEQIIFATFASPNV